MRLFAAPQPVEPEPDPEFDYNLIKLVISALVIFFGLAYYLVSRNWRRWTEKAIDKAFTKTDLDGSGKINRDELYIGVCETYLTLHMYGLNAKPPKRAHIMALMKLLDNNNSGEIDRTEFKDLIQQLLLAQSGRLGTQMGTTVLCPISAGYVTFGIKHLWGYFGLPSILPFPDSFFEGTMDETIMAGILMCSINPMLSLYDRLVAKELSERRVELKTTKKAK